MRFQKTKSTLGKFTRHSYFIPRRKEWHTLIDDDEYNSPLETSPDNDQEIIIRRQWEFLTTEVDEDDPTVLTDFSQPLQPIKPTIDNILKTNMNDDIELEVIGELSYSRRESRRSRRA